MKFIDVLNRGHPIYKTKLTERTWDKLELEAAFFCFFLEYVAFWYVLSFESAVPDAVMSEHVFSSIS